jgi:hypothetical protein
VTHGAPPPLGGDPSRWRLGYRACPCGHTTNLPGCLRWLCFARSPVQSSLGTPHSQGPSPRHWLCFARRPPFATGGLCPRYLTPSIRNPRASRHQGWLCFAQSVPFVVTHGAPPPSAVVPAEGGWATGHALAGTRQTYRAVSVGFVSHDVLPVDWLCFTKPLIRSNSSVIAVSRPPASLTARPCRTQWS